LDDRGAAGDGVAHAQVHKREAPGEPAVFMRKIDPQVGAWRGPEKAPLDFLCASGPVHS
jgi:hypothetical protein